MCPATRAYGSTSTRSLLCQTAAGLSSKIPKWTVRRAFLHIIEAMARHAGLTDIIRESIDGATLYQLVALLEGGLSERRAQAANASTLRTDALA